MPAMLPHQGARERYLPRARSEAAADVVADRVVAYSLFSSRRHAPMPQADADADECDDAKNDKLDMCFKC